MKETMVCMLVGFVTNIILDPLLIFGIGPFSKMGHLGCCLRNRIRSGSDAGCLFHFLLSQAPVVHITVADCKPDASILKRLYGVGIPATLNMALPSFLISVLNAILAGFSETYVMVLWGVLQITDIYLSVCHRYCSGYPSSRRIQLRRRREGKRVRKIYATGLVLTVFSWY